MLLKYVKINIIYNYFVVINFDVFYSYKKNNHKLISKFLNIIDMSIKQLILKQ